MNEKTLGALFAIAAKIVIGITVLLFLGLHSLTFFTFVFTGQNEIYAYLGFGLTAGAVIAYAAAFKWHCKTRLNQFVSISMMGLCLIGELATAGFGMQIEAFKAANLQFTEADISTMIIAVQLLGVIHGLALIADLMGEDIIKAFKAKADEPIPVHKSMPFILKEQTTERQDLPPLS